MWARRARLPCVAAAPAVLAVLMLAPPAQASQGGGLDLRNLAQAPDLPSPPGGREIEVPPEVNDRVGEVGRTAGGVADRVLAGGAPPPIGKPPPPPVDPGPPTGPGTDPPVDGGPSGADRSKRSPKRSPERSPESRRAGGGGSPLAAAVSSGGAPADVPERVDLVASPTPGGPNETTQTTQAGLPGRVFEALKALPMGILVAVIGLAVLGIAMAVRSAWLSSIASRLRRKALDLSNDVEFLQDALLPPIPPRIGGVELSVAYRAADGPAAGGDFHDIVALGDGKVGVLVGDVSGHGRQALGATALVHYTLRAHLEAGVRPCEVVRLTDSTLSGKLRMHYATVLVGVYDEGASTFDYATAGHPAPLIRGEAHDHAVQGLSPPIGLGHGAGSRETRVSLEAGGAICCFTDGLIEARNGNGEMLAREGLASILEGLENRKDAGDLLARLSAATSGPDDLTACLLRPLEASGDGRIVEEIEIGAPDSLRPLGEFLGRCGMPPGEASAAIEEIHRRRLHGEGSLLRVIRASAGISWEVGEGPQARVPPAAAEPAPRARGSYASTVIAH